MQGSCGYGVMDKTKYPFWSVAALSKTNPFYVAGPLGGCGECFEIQCLDSGGQYAVCCLPNAFALKLGHQTLRLVCLEPIAIQKAF